MNYDLANELFGAGYPMSKPWKENDEYPTLSELIDACNTHSKFKLSYEKQFLNWRASAYENWHEYADGSSPEEAVARLWLALSKDK